MKTSSFRNRLLWIAFAAIPQILPAAELDVRVANGTDIAMLIDFDAIRRSGASIGKMATAAIDESVRVNAFGEKAGNGMKDFGRMFASKAADAGIAQKDLHWMLFGLRAAEYYVSDRQAFTQQVWSVVAAVDGCDWKRIGDAVAGSGLEWQEDTVFGHRVFSAARKEGKATRYSLRCVPGGDNMAYLGSGASREWECYNANARQDARFSGMGHLEDGEVVRISLVDEKPLSEIVRHLYRGLFPMGAEQIPDRLRNFRLSVFLDGRSASAMLVFSCADEADAEALSKAYLAMKSPQGIAAMVKRFERANGGRNNGLADIFLNLKKGIVENMEVSCNGEAVVVKTGKQDAEPALTVLLGSIGSFIDFIETFFK